MSLPHLICQRHLKKMIHCSNNDISFFSCVLNKDMTGLVIPYQVPGPFDGLANWSPNFQFKAQDVVYPSVDHYIYCALTRREHNAQMLSTNDNYVLRQRFNDISNKMYIKAIREIASKGVEKLKISNSNVHSFMKEYPSFYYYYISNDIHLGINEHGYGYNLIGQAFSQSKSAVFPITESYIYMIYKASVLLVQYLKDVGDIRQFIGVSVNDIVQILSTHFPKFIYVSSIQVFQTFQKDSYFNYIQYELDYPMNLAGFIRQIYIHQINHYMRKNFNTIMIRHYFEYILKKKYNHVIDQSQMNYYINQQMAKLNDESFQTLSTRLFEIYNDPDTNKKTHSFLTFDVRNQLYEMEIQFLSKNEIIEGETYVPFLFQVRLDRSLYIYDHDFGENPIEPFTRYISPFSTVLHFDGYRSLGEYIYTNLCDYLTQDLEQNIKKEFMSCVDLTSFQEKLKMMVDNHKLSLMKRGMNLKFSTNRFARYLLNDTQKYMFNINLTDPDPIFNENVTKHLLHIRKELKDPMYSILYSFVENIYLQDRVRYRIEDFMFTYDIYRKYLNQPLLTMKDMVYLQEFIFKDPFFNGLNTKPVHPAFFVLFKDICERPVINKLWNGLTSFVNILEKNIESLSSSPPKVNDGISVKSIVPIVCSLVQNFYTPDDESTRFYDFVISLLIGKQQTFKPSVTYYSIMFDDEFKKYLPIDNYDALFVVNLFGICLQVQRNIDANRFKYFSFLRMKPQEIPYPSSLSNKINKHIYMELPKKTSKKKKSMKELKEVFDKKKTVQDDEDKKQEEEEETLAEMLKDLGLEEEEEEEIEDLEDDNEDFD